MMEEPVNSTEEWTEDETFVEGLDQREMETWLGAKAVLRPLHQQHGLFSCGNFGNASVVVCKEARIGNAMMPIGSR